MAKMSILFDGFADLAAEIDRSDGDLHAAVDEALTATQKLIQGNLEEAAAAYATKGVKGYATGKMYETILKDPQVDWHGSIAEVGVGFGLDQNGGWHSIFVMYGTPRMNKDQKVYNAIKGSKIKKAVAALQQEIMQKNLDLAKGQ